MKDALNIITSEEVRNKFDAYPKHVKPKLQNLRQLILKVAKEDESISEIVETLKWGEPSYLTKKGSTLRIDWKNKTPNQYALYFKCTSQLIPTIKSVFGNKFSYENNRTILFDLDAVIPQKELSTCISLALSYHKVKNKPLLGINKDEMLN